MIRGWLRRRALPHLAERVRVDVWLLQICADEPIPFWPMETPDEVVVSASGPL